MKGPLTKKIDMAKAYDRVAWAFLHNIMLKLGFHDQCVEKLMWCVKIVSYQIVHNRMELGPIILECGLHQGDRISSFLFIMCTCRRPINTYSRFRG